MHNRNCTGYLNEAEKLSDIWMASKKMMPRLLLFGIRLSEIYVQRTCNFSVNIILLYLVAKDGTCYNEAPNQGDFGQQSERRWRLGMDQEKYLILINGQDKTDAIASFRMEGQYCEIIYANSSKSVPLSAG